MTLMFASVKGPAEAEVALREGADIIDLMGAGKGTVEVAEPTTLHETLARLARRRPICATAGDIAMEPSHLREAVMRLSANGVDFIKLGLLPRHWTQDCLATLQDVSSRAKLIGLLFADQRVDITWLEQLSQAGFVGALLDTTTKNGKRLMDHMDIAALDAFVQACRRVNLMAGLAGALEAPDVARLLFLEPDFLAFRGASRGGKSRGTGIVPRHFRLIRELIPRADKERDRSEDRNVDWRFLAARDQAPESEAKPATDRVFVRDFILAVSIGAYDAERNDLQRVRFSVDVDVRRMQRHAEDMRDVFSYDLIIDTIRLFLSRGHVALVETLGEDICNALFAHPRVVSINIRIEKLDVVEGSVGVELRRERMKPAASSQRRPIVLSEVNKSL